MELIIKKCAHCGAMVEVLKDCTCGNCGIKCCGESMTELKPNTMEASKEKHLPKVEVVGNNIVVGVDHVMEDEHYIEWIAVASDNGVCRKTLKAGTPAKAIFPYIAGSRVYAMCNKHGLWESVVE